MQDVSTVTFRELVDSALLKLCLFIFLLALQIETFKEVLGQHSAWNWVSETVKKKMIR